MPCGRPSFDSWVRKIPWRRESLPTPVFLPAELHGQRSLVGFSVCVCVCVCVFLKSCIANTKSVLCPRERGATVYIPGRGNNMLTVSSKSFLVKLNWGMMEEWTCKDHEECLKCQELRMSKDGTLEIDYSIVEQFHWYLNVSTGLEKCLRNIQFY